MGLQKSQMWLATKHQQEWPRRYVFTFSAFPPTHFDSILVQAFIGVTFAEELFSAPFQVLSQPLPPWILIAALWGWQELLFPLYRRNMWGLKKLNIAQIPASPQFLSPGLFFFTTSQSFPWGKALHAIKFWGRRNFILCVRMYPVICL